MDQPNTWRIVLVDDDDFVREGMEMSLEGAGHRIRATGSGGEALRWLEDEPCDLLIVDFSMREMDGPELYRRVLARWPARAPRVLFVSGYAADHAAQHRQDDHRGDRSGQVLHPDQQARSPRAGQRMVT